MTRSPVPYGYRLRVSGHLDDHWLAWLGSLILARENDGTTTLTGPVTDQAALHRLLAKIRDLGILLISVEPVAATDSGGSDANAALAGKGAPIPQACEKRAQEAPERRN
jgi:hypothetical protein